MGLNKGYPISSATRDLSFSRVCLSAVIWFSVAGRAGAGRETSLSAFLSWWGRAGAYSITPRDTAGSCLQGSQHGRGSGRASGTGLRLCSALLMREWSGPVLELTRTSESSSSHLSGRFRSKIYQMPHCIFIFLTNASLHFLI
jgi:hypothetical protein